MLKQLTKSSLTMLGAGITQRLERRTRDRKFPSSSPRRSGGRIFFSMVNFLCWLLLRYPLHLRVTVVVHKRSQSLCQKCRWHVTAKHARTVPMWLWMKWHCKLVHGWMVYTEPASKRQQCHVAPAMQQPNSAVSAPFRWVLKLDDILKIKYAL